MIEIQIEGLQKNILKFEQTKWELIAEMTAEVTVSEEEAEPLVAELIQEVEQVTGESSADVSAEMVMLLQQILDKLNEPESPAAAKLKAAITSFPPFVGLSYKAELDTDFCETKFPDVWEVDSGGKRALKKVVGIAPRRIPSNLGSRGIRADSFVGREAELAELHEFLKQKEVGNLPVVIQGIAGVGKSELGIQYAQQFRVAYPGGVT